MPAHFTTLPKRFQNFIEAQKVFFVATAAKDGRVNLSPKGLDTLRVLAPSRIVWLSLSGSGNETAAHLKELNRITMMFCAFEGKALILRVYGTARVLHPRDTDWAELKALFPDLGGARQIFDVTIDTVTTSCGTGVPQMTVTQERGPTELEPFYAAMSERELQDYWAKKNALSLDGRDTGIFE